MATERIVRPATDEDDYRIEDVRVASWRVAYAHLIPPDYFDGWDYDAVISSRQASRRPAVSGLVSEEPDGAISGFVFAGPSRDEDCAGEGEIYAFYVAPRFWGQGVAAQLMQRILEELDAHAVVRLWCLTDNPRAHAFYRKHGFEPDGAEQAAALPKRLTLPEIRFRLQK